MSDNIQEAEVGSGTKISDVKQSEKRAQLTLKAIQLRLKQEKERAAIQQQKKSLRTEETVEESFSPSQIAALKAEYSKIGTIDPDSDTYKKLIAMLDRLDLKSLKSLAGAEIKFVSKLAQNRVARKNMKEETQLDELSNEKLADYKKKAGEDASKADKEGDIKKGNKRFSGIMKATRKQFDNDDKKTNEDVAEASQRVDSLVTDALKVMQGSELKDAVQALKTVLGDREYNGRRGHYNFYVKQLVDMYGKKTNEELSPKQKALDKNKNGKIDGSDLAKLRGEELSAKQKALDKNNNGKIDGSDLAHLRSKKKQPQGADFAAQRRKERMASNGRMDEESINETGGPKVFQKDNKHIEKYSDDKFWLYVDNKKTKEFSSLEMAKAAALKEHFDLQEKSDYEVYHKDYSGAVQTAIKQAEKRGYEVDMDDWHDKVATGPKKPSSGKTNSFSINLMKDGKPSKKKLHLQVYNMDNHKYELNMYIESVEEAASPAQQAAIAIAMKKAGKKPKDMEESDAYDKDVKPSDKPHDKDAAAKRAKLAALAARKKMAEGLMDKIRAMKRGAEAKAKADDHFDKAGDPKNANASKDLKKAVRYHNLLNKEGTGPDLNPVAKHVTKGELKKSGISKWLAVSEEDKVPEFKSGGPELAKKFNKAFKALGVNANVKIKTVGNVSVNEEEIIEAKKPKKLKDVMKKKKIKEETPSKKTVERGDQLTGKKEPIEINPELKENKE
jgi:hypothetical protein